jgi:hypothetical protein
MPDSISWSFNAAAASGATGRASGKTDVDAVMTATKSVMKSTPLVLDLQADASSKIVFLCISSSSPESTVKVGTGASAKQVTLTGPLILYGDGIKLFSDDLSAVSVTGPATGATTAAADISILLGLKIV